MVVGCERAEPKREKRAEIVVPDPEEGQWDFRFDAPADFVWQEELVPIDVRGKVWRAPGISEFGISLDSYASQAPGCDMAACRQWQEPLSGGTASFTRDAYLNKKEGVNSSLLVHLPLIRRRDHVTLALVISARCATRAACDRALAVARTVRAMRRPAVGPAI